MIFTHSIKHLPDFLIKNYLLVILNNDGSSVNTYFGRKAFCFEGYLLMSRADAL